MFSPRYSLSAVLAVGILLRTGVLATPQISSADALFAQGKFDQAKTAYTSAVHASPTGVTNRVQLVRTLMRLDDWKGAVTQARAATAAAPKSGEAHGILSIALFRAGQPEEALAEAKSAVASEPAAYWALMAAGRSAIWNQDGKTAKTALRRATVLHPEWPEGWYLLRDALDSKDQDEWHKAMDTLVKLKPKGHPYEGIVEGVANDRIFEKSIAKEKLAEPTGRYDATVMHKVDSGSAPAISVTIPIERDDTNFVIVPVKINGRRLKLLLDTGAGDQIFLTGGIGGRLGSPALSSSVAYGVNGSEKTHRYKADMVEIGDLALRSVPYEGGDGVLDESFDGLIGGAFFQEYAVTVDFHDNTMTLTRGKDVAAPAPAEGNRVLSVPFHLVDGYIYMPTEIAGRKTWCMLDSGAGGVGVLSLDLAKQIATERGKATYISGTIEGHLGIGNTVNKIDVMVFGLSVPVGFMRDGHAPFHMEANPMYGASIMDTEVSHVSDFQFGALVGIDYLSSARRVTIDYPHQILTMEFGSASETQ